MRAKTLLLILPIILTGCVLPYGDSFAQTTYYDSNASFYSNVPGQANVTIIQNRPVAPYPYYNGPNVYINNNRGYDNRYYNNRPNQHYYNGRYWNVNPGYNEGYNNRRPDYERWRDRNNRNPNDRFDRTQRNPRYVPPVQLSPGRDTNQCVRQGCAKAR